MTRHLRRMMLLCALALPAAFGQLELYVVDGNVEHLLPAVYDLGSIYPGEPLAAKFRLRNTSAASVPVSVLAIAGSGFSISGSPVLPTVLASQQAIEFQVNFQVAGIATYSAALYSEGVSALLTVTVQPRLSPVVDGPAGPQPLGSAAVDFGSAELGTAVQRSIVLENRTPLILVVPAIAIGGEGFRLVDAAPSGSVLNPGDSVRFQMEFRPGAAGAAAGTLMIGDRSYTLAGAGASIPLPNATIDLTQPGVAMVVFDAPARTAGQGTISLGFKPAAANAVDSGIQFGAGSRSLTFSFAAADRQVAIPYRTGTTAGTLAFTVQLGTAKITGSVDIAPSAVTISSAGASRTASSIEIRIEGADNTRSVSQIAYSFFDANGNLIPPGVLRVDSTADFARFFQNADGGGFLLRSVFPITGDTSQIRAFRVEITNTAGAASTARVSF